MNDGIYFIRSLLEVSNKEVRILMIDICSEQSNPVKYDTVNKENRRLLAILHPRQ